jgi:hypothetical protein
VSPAPSQTIILKNLKMPKPFSSWTCLWDLPSPFCLGSKTYISLLI